MLKTVGRVMDVQQGQWGVGLFPSMRPWTPARTMKAISHNITSIQQRLSVAMVSSRGFLETFGFMSQIWAGDAKNKQGSVVGDSRLYARSGRQGLVRTGCFDGLSLWP